MEIHISDVATAKEAAESSMSLLQFFAEAIKALAWPLATVVLAFLLKGNLVTLIRNIRSVKAGGVEASFNEQIEESSLTENVTPDNAAKFSNTNITLDQIKSNPEGAVVAAWKKIEGQLLRILDGVLPNNKKNSPLAMNKLATEHDIMSYDDIAKLTSLRRLRNTAVHATGEQVSYASALEYVAAADEIVKKLISIPKISSK